MKTKPFVLVIRVFLTACHSHEIDSASCLLQAVGIWYKGKFRQVGTCNTQDSATLAKAKRIARDALDANAKKGPRYQDVIQKRVDAAHDAAWRTPCLSTRRAILAPRKDVRGGAWARRRAWRGQTALGAGRRRHCVDSACFCLVRNIALHLEP